MGNLCSEKRENVVPAPPNPTKSLKPLIDPPKATTQDEKAGDAGSSSQRGADAPPPVVNPPKEDSATKKQLVGGMSGMGPRWTWDSTVEKPAGEKNMGTWTRAIYTPEQQARLGVGEDGNALAEKQGDEESFTTGVEFPDHSATDPVRPRGGTEISEVGITYSDVLPVAQPDSASEEENKDDTAAGMDSMASLPPQASLPPAEVEDAANGGLGVDLDGPSPTDDVPTEKQGQATDATAKKEDEAFTPLKPGETIHDRISMTDFSTKVAEAQDKAILDSFEQILPNGLPEATEVKPVEYPVDVAG